MISRSPIAVCVLGFVSMPASGQDINIDFSGGPIMPAGTPGATYAGAGLAGVWNAIDGPGGTPQGLVDLGGQAIPATLSVTFASYWGADDPGTSGDDAALLDDGLSGLGDIMNGVTFANLTNGVYQVIAYGWTPANPIDSTFLMVEGLLPYGLVTGGPWPGGFVEGITHGILWGEVTDGTLTVGYAGGMWGHTGFLNALQLQRLQPLIGDFNDDGMIDEQDRVVLAAQFGLSSSDVGFNPWADLNSDGVINEQDVLIFNTILPPCPADCSPDNGDGTFGNGLVNIDDLVAVLNAFGFGGGNGPCDITPDNLNATWGNGVVNIDDLVAVLNAFGACP